MGGFMGINPMNPKLKENDIAKQLNHSGSTLQRYKKDIIMLSLYRTPTNSHEKRQKPHAKT